MNLKWQILSIDHGYLNMCTDKTGKINVFRNYETNKCGPHHITRTSGEMNTYLYNSVMDTLHVIKGKTILHQYHHCICNISRTSVKLFGKHVSMLCVH